ncbi:unnamed protein product (macronuclear) [Paramecium tetraurelia]|uniref:Uncharacterized protein n=1 Tax=Paramecium tetraurelia TaxID=5888 RepID=A0EC48_PARTE|nr:uncharacterized protein GSPATT00025601001 [Paramecium tetraurelia]CAK92865.1 unnamed protein product [Paramecium tetraurelia]|eukprot:XP_001460262.1 hypothetical protein (macronuclear) [Paramecium tetraurelia strain d4-2]
MMEERRQRSNEKVNGQLDYQTRKIISPQTDVNFKKENSNPLDQNSSFYSLKGYERQAPYKSNQYDQNRQTGEPLKIGSTNNPYLQQSVSNNNEQEQIKPFIRPYQEGDQRKPLDQVNYKYEQRQLNEKGITSPYGNIDNKKRDTIGTRTPFDPNVNMSSQTPLSRQDNCRRDTQLSEQKREFQLPEYKRMYPEDHHRIHQRQMSSFDMKQMPVDQGDRTRYEQERIKTLGGQQEQPERMDRLIRASDYVRKPDNNDLYEQDKRVLERREQYQRGGVEQGLYDQRNSAKSQEYSQRQQNQIRRPQEVSKTPVEGRVSQKRGFDDQIQQDGKFNQSQYPEGRIQQQQFYDIPPPLDDQRRMPNPYDERRYANPYEHRPQTQDQRPPFERRPDRPENERRLERPEFDRRLEFENRSPYQARFGPEVRPEMDQRIPPEYRNQQGYNYERFQQYGFRQGMEEQYQNEVRQPQKQQFQEIPACNYPDRFQEASYGMNYRKYPDARFIQDGQKERREFLEGSFGIMQGRPEVTQGRPELPQGRPGLMEGRQQQIDVRGGLNRTYGEELTQGASNGFDGRREQFGIRPPIQSRPYEERGNFEQRVHIETKNQYQKEFDDKFGDRYFEQKYTQKQDIMGRKDFGRSDYGKLREELDRRNNYERPVMETNMSEFGKRREFDGATRPETNFGRTNDVGQKPDERYLRREYQDQGQKLSYHNDTSVMDRLGLEKGTNLKIIGNQAAENMLRGGQPMNRQYDRERGLNRLGMGERVGSFTNNKMGYQRTAVQDREEYQAYVRSKLLLKPALENDTTDLQRMKSQDQGFQKLQSPKGQIDTRIGGYDIQRREGRI